MPCRSGSPQGVFGGLHGFGADVGDCARPSSMPSDTATPTNSTKIVPWVSVRSIDDIWNRSPTLRIGPLPIGRDCNAASAKRAVIVSTTTLKLRNGLKTVPYLRLATGDWRLATLERLRATRH